MYVPKYDIKKTKKLKFARFGGLSSVNQTGYDPNSDDFHSPPTSRGFYAFVWPYYEMFLLGAPQTLNPYVIGAKFSYVRDKDEKIVDSNHPEYETLAKKHQNKYWSISTKAWYEFLKKLPVWDDPEYDIKDEALRKEWDKKCSGVAKWVLVARPHPKIFEFDGVLWSHLGDHLRPEQILARTRDWTKSTVADYRIALDKEMGVVRKADAHIEADYSKTEKEFCFSCLFRKNPFRNFRRDNLEVFIEKI